MLDHKPCIDHCKTLQPLQVSGSSILQTAPVEKALNAAAAAAQQHPTSSKQLLQTYAALAVLRQTALSLTEYGIRCAHLYLSHNMNALPVLKG